MSSDTLGFICAPEEVKNQGLVDWGLGLVIWTPTVGFPFKQDYNCGAKLPPQATQFWLREGIEREKKRSAKKYNGIYHYTLAKSRCFTFLRGGSFP